MSIISRATVMISRSRYTSEVTPLTPRHFPEHCLNPSMKIKTTVRRYQPAAKRESNAGRIICTLAYRSEELR